MSKADLSKEKILNEAINEFAHAGYAGASTNKIMQNTGLAKGLLFHYFPSKQALFNACLENILSTFQKDLDIFMQNMSEDLFERLADFLTWKSRLAQEQPITLRFLLGLTNLPPEIRVTTDDLLLTLRQKNSKLLSNYDKTLWNPKINQKDALQVIVMVFEAFDQKMIMQMNSKVSYDPKEMLPYALSMLEVLKTGFYTSN